LEQLGILSLLCFIWAGPTSLGFCLLTCTFISLFSSGSGRTSNEFQPCSKPCPLVAIYENHFALKRNRYISRLLCFLIPLCTLLLGCIQPRKGDELTKFKSFQYSYQNSSTLKYFSVMFTQSDTFFLKRYSLTNHDTLSYSLLSFTVRDKINAFVKKINSFISFSDSLNDLKDGPERIVFELSFINETSSIYCQSFHPPLTIVEFKNFIDSLKNHSTFIPIDTVIQFREDIYLRKAIQNNSH
jgi:hypothetical protein